MTLVSRVQRAVSRHGVRSAVQRVLMITRRTIGRSLYLHERHVWYLLDLAHDRFRLALPKRFTLVRADEAELPFLYQLPTVGLHEAQRRLAAGADLWLVLDGERAVFSCWIFRHPMPVLAARR